MTLDDQKFEQHLRDFHPRPPAPLIVPHLRRRPLIIAAVAFACVLVAACAILFPHAKPAVHPSVVEKVESRRTPVTLMEFNAAARAGRLDEALSLSAAHSLPHTNRPNTALNVLAKE